MNRSIFAVSVAVASFAFGVSGAVQASSIITDWNFGSPTLSSTNNANYSPAAATTGTGTATALGMTNGYTYTNGAGGTYLGTGSVTDSDIVNDSPNGSKNGSTYGTGNVWRIRGASGTGTSGSGNNGWNISAPEYSQGAEFDTSTVGYTVTQLSFNWAATTQGVDNLQVQYNLNVNNASGWTNVGSVWSATVDNNATSSAGSGFATDTVSLAGISGLGNDPNFGIRLVSAYNPTLGNQYASATSVLSGTPAEINNMSGNWRIADVQIDGTPVPLPASVWLLLSSCAGVAFFSRRRKMAFAV